jgi:hypothetical protein
VNGAEEQDRDTNWQIAIDFAARRPEQYKAIVEYAALVNSPLAREAANEPP